MDNNLSQLIENGVTIVTSTTRLSRHISYQFSQEKIKKKTSWITPDCLPWEAWCKTIFDEFLFSAKEPWTLLNQFQQQWLWERIIKNSKYTEPLSRIDAILKEAIHCYKLCKEWDISIFPEDIDMSGYADAFKEWVDVYEKKKNNNHWLDDTCLPDYIASHFKEITFHSEKVIFYGFDQLTEQQLRLKELLNDLNMYVDLPEAEDRHKVIEYSEQEDEDSEIRAAACWAKKKLKENSDISVGIVVKNVNRIREKLEYGFSSVLTPEKFTKSQSQFHKPYSISRGKPLSTYPLINIAINLLSLGSEEISMSNLSALLNSRFIRGVTAEAGAKFDMKLRGYGETKFTLADVISMNNKECRDFIKLLKDFNRSFQSLFKKKMKLSQWITKFTDWLTIFGWPIEESLNSEEYQALQRWNDVLNYLGSLSEFDESVNFETAFSQLKKMLVETSFQTETPYETPIQILDVIGTAGAQFNYLWVMNARDDIWPSFGPTCGFIPLSCRKKIPGKTPESRLQMTEDITNEVVRSAENLVFSYIKDEKGNARLSPFIKKHQPEKYRGDSEEDDYRKTIFKKTAIEKIEDIKAPAINKNHKFVANSSLLKDQFNCPFRAFANHRLNTRVLEEPEDGLDAAKRGTLTHEVMRHFWKEVKTWKNLKSQNEMELDKSINSAVSKAIKDMSSKRRKTFSTSFVELEQERLHKLLKEWLQIELDRLPFEVLEKEKDKVVIFDGMEFHLRIDRIDRLDDDSHWIIDYKTGSVNKKDWDVNRSLSEKHRHHHRIKEPQMSLYAVTCEYPLSSLFYACLKPGELGFVGDTVFDKILTKWEEDLKVGTTEFREGCAIVDPMANACTFCNLDSLCRIKNKKERPRRR